MFINATINFEDIQTIYSLRTGDVVFNFSYKDLVYTNEVQSTLDFPVEIKDLGAIKKLEKAIAEDYIIKNIRKEEEFCVLVASKIITKTFTTWNALENFYKTRVAKPVNISEFPLLGAPAPKKIEPKKIEIKLEPIVVERTIIDGDHYRSRIDLFIRYYFNSKECKNENYCGLNCNLAHSRYPWSASLNTEFEKALRIYEKNKNTKNLDICRFLTIGMHANRPHLCATEKIQMKNILKFYNYEGINTHPDSYLDITDEIVNELQQCNDPNCTAKIHWVR